MSKFLSGLRLGRAIKGFLPTGGLFRDFSPETAQTLPVKSASDRANTPSAQEKKRPPFIGLKICRGSAKRGGRAPYSGFINSTSWP